MSKRWPFTLGAAVFLLPGAILNGLGGSSHDTLSYVGLSCIMLGCTISLFPQRPRKRRWLAVGTFFVLAEMGVVLPAFWLNGMTPFTSILFVVAGILAAAFIPPRMPLWPKKVNPEEPA